jgi:hypothetical protein
MIKAVGEPCVRCLRFSPLSVSDIGASLHKEMLSFEFWREHGSRTRGLRRDRGRYSQVPVKRFHTHVGWWTQERLSAPLTPIRICLDHSRFAAARRLVELGYFHAVHQLDPLYVVQTPRLAMLARTRDLGGQRSHVHLGGELGNSAVALRTCAQ